MKISVIFWDANFREHLHAIDFFGNQQFDQRDYEMIWVDFYDSNDAVRKKIESYPNARLVTLGQGNDTKWHLGRCINYGIEHSSGDLLIIPDGDIVVEPDFISFSHRAHRTRNDLALYFHRHDEPKEASCEKSRQSISHLEKYARLTNPNNYAGCLSIRRENLKKLGAYELHTAFGGPGANGLELYTRIRNCGLSVQWSPQKKLYHPWHPGTGESDETMKRAMVLASHHHSWINTYAGLAQSWIIKCRGLNGEFKADADACDEYLSRIPDIRLDLYANIVKRLRSQDALRFTKSLESILSETIQLIEKAAISDDRQSGKNEALRRSRKELLKLRSDLHQPPVGSFLDVVQNQLSKMVLLQTRISSLEKNLTSCREKLRDRNLEISQIKSSTVWKIRRLIHKLLHVGTAGKSTGR